VIAMMFLSASLRFDATRPVVMLFIGAVLTFCLGLVWFLARNLCGHGEPAHRRSLSRSALNIWALRPFAIRNLYRVFNVVRKLA
jgi:hypothetical protein